MKKERDSIAKVRKDFEDRFRKIESTLPFVSPVINNRSAPTIGVVTMPSGAKVELTEAEIAAGVVIQDDGTKQFPNAPTGPVVDHPPAKMEAVPARYGKGAIVRRKGQPFTSEVQAVGDGEIFVTVMNNGEPKDIWAPWGDFDLLSAAPV